MLNRHVFTLAASLALTIAVAPQVRAADKAPAGKSAAAKPADTKAVKKTPPKAPAAEAPKAEAKPAKEETAETSPAEKPAKKTRTKKEIAAGECCRVCKSGKACGDTCISKDRECNEPKGCACEKK